MSSCIKKTLAILVLLFAAFLAFAWNEQSVIPIDSEVYDALDALYTMEGKAIPSTTRPWTVAEAQKYLSCVSEITAPQLYALVAREIGEKETISFDEVFGLKLALHSHINAYYHTNTSFDYPFDDADSLLFRTFNRNDVSTLRADIEAFAGKNFTLYSSFALKNAVWPDGVPLDSYHFNFDIAYLTPQGFSSCGDMLIPDRAYVSAGGDYWNIQLGKDRLSIGAGKTGNMIMSDSFPYQYLLRFNLFGSAVKFSYVLSSFLPLDYWTIDDESMSGMYLYMTNRLEGHLFSDKLYFAFNASTMLINEYDGVNLKFLNPVDIYHNFFVRYRQNSSFAFEAVYAVAKGWNAYFQCVLDDLTTPGEKGGDDPQPDEFGLLAGIGYCGVLGKGIMSLNLEAAYTLPYLYLRSTYCYDQPDDDPGVNWIGIYRCAGGNLHCKRYFIGYPYGGDAAVLDFRFEYFIPGDIELKAETFFMIHGEKNYDSIYRIGNNSYALSGELKYYAYLELFAKKAISENISLFGQYDLAYGAGETDNQFVLGAEFSI